ncbi:hypothetical protein Q5P01_019487 [Channa striata]|uniref:Uncharacterized protein n=1 Tax=Channa striata TaxID=64152 RepID=A0AA88M462_CHASR|nr:hypothetical protein Q5P01_019487 [Channa striata]
MIARNVWLYLSSIPETIRRDMLEGPISPHRLFGPHFQHLMKEMQMVSEEAVKIPRHVKAFSRSLLHILRWQRLVNRTERLRREKVGQLVAQYSANDGCSMSRRLCSTTERNLQ